MKALEPHCNRRQGVQPSARQPSQWSLSSACSQAAGLARPLTAQRRAPPTSSLRFGKDSEGTTRWWSGCHHEGSEGRGGAWHSPQGGGQGGERRSLAFSPKEAGVRCGAEPGVLPKALQLKQSWARWARGQAVFCRVSEASPRPLARLDPGLEEAVNLSPVMAAAT